MRTSALLLFLPSLWLPTTSVFCWVYSPPAKSQRQSNLLSSTVFHNNRVHPLNTTRLSLSLDKNNEQAIKSQQQEPPNVFGESLKLRFTLWAIEFFGIVPEEQLARQTLEFILNFMKRLEVYDLLFAPYWKDRLEQCARETVRLQSKQMQQIAPNLADLQGTTWRLAYTNDFKMLPPSRRMAYLKFNMDDDGSTLQYSFETKMEGWTNVVANCPVEQLANQNQLAYYFDEVKTERGEEVNGGLYGMQQGTSRVIHTAYFDGQIWIDMEPNKSKGGGAVTVYIQEYYK